MSDEDKQALLEVYGHLVDADNNGDCSMYIDESMLILERLFKRHGITEHKS